ncbi:MAG: ATP-dependent DNA helicase [Pyrinomonadaceae bacterium]|nr:ATP-dependent DNA helicase [Pyrinomonadaceae bacterium]MCX7640343.1 ATP-dependent DNA helicase [Pyrinomonadaceae bacterium]MDW8304770.1 ATP-dependent DNA helicase [Acidobacteriota bacterium]
MFYTIGRLFSSEEIFGVNGIIAQGLGRAYEFRPSQIKMAEAVSKALLEKRHLIVEAGTGTGKTLAYLVSAVDYALRNKKRVIISTGTKNLQDQLIKKDIPFLLQILKFKAVCIKGRSNYLCLNRMKRLSNQPILQNLEEVDAFRDLESWSEETQTGDFAELLIPENAPFLKYISARSETCLGQQCADFDRCFITKMRKEAESAQIIVVNHHLLFADLMVRENEYGKVLPDYDVVIFDEAHLIEDVAANYFGFEVSKYQIEELIELANFEYDNRIAEILKNVHKAANESFEKVSQFIGNEVKKQILRSDLYLQEGFTVLGEALTFLDKALESLENGIKESSVVLENPDCGLSFSIMVEKGEEDAEKETFLRYLKQIRLALQRILNCSDENFVYWAERQNGSLTLHASPISVSHLLRERIFENSTVILTSATLSSEGSFDYIKKRLGLFDDSCETLLLGSGFDYRKQALLYLPEDMPEPNSSDYIQQMAKEIVKILQVTQGRAFVLCTSNQSMNALYELVKGQVSFQCFVQGQSSRATLLDTFKQTPNSVLFATSSFWQGVDVVGDQLSCVIIDKLPFAVPTDPLLKARAEFIKRQGGDAFNEYFLPQAIILLRQGVGRLIRSKRDKGVVAILDPRIRTKSYGKKFINSLPEMKITSRLEDLKQFLGVCEHFTK